MDDSVSKDVIDKAKRLNNFWYLNPKRVCNKSLVDDVVNTLMSEMEVYGVNIPFQDVYLRNLREHVRKILMNLHCAYLNDPEKYVAYSRDGSGYKHDRNRKGFQFSFDNVRKVADFLISKGYVEHEKGHSASEKYAQGHLSRMRATVKLIDMFEKEDEEISVDDYKLDTTYDEIIVVKGVKPKKKVRIKIEDGKEKRVT